MRFVTYQNTICSCFSITLGNETYLEVSSAMKNAYTNLQSTVLLLRAFDLT